MLMNINWEKEKRSMHYHSLKEEHKKDYNHYKRVRRISYLKVHMGILPKRKEQQIEEYHYLYEEDHALNDDNGLKAQHYYIPEALIVSDIILKEKLTDVKKGLKQVLKNQLSHKFLGIYKSEQDIDDLVNSLDLAITEGKSWQRIGRFDVENIKKLREKIDYFDIVIRNFSTSYLEVEFYLYFTEKEKKALNEFTRSNYNAKTKTVDFGYTRNKKKTGAKLNCAVGIYTDNQEKSELLYDEIEECKFIFLKLMHKYFPLVLFENGHIPIGMIVSKTNIHYEEMYSDFWESVGVGRGTFKDKTVKLFPRYELSRKNRNIQTNYILIYNEDKLENKYLHIYNGNKLQFIMKEIFSNLQELYKIIVITNIAEYYNVRSAFFRNKINKVAAKKKSYPRLLKIRYLFHTDFELMEKIKKEVDLEKLVQNTEKYFEDNFLIKYDRTKSYKYISTYPVQRFKLYEKNKEILEERLNEKIVLSRELKQYNEGKKGWIINIITFFISIGTFIFLIFPIWAERIAKMLNVFWDLLLK